jgi:hypothetical protein
VGLEDAQRDVMAMNPETASAIGQRGSTKTSSSSTRVTRSSQREAEPGRIIRMG